MNPPSTPLFDSPRDEAFFYQRTTGQLTKNLHWVYDLIKRHGPITIQELEKQYNVPINIGSGRTSDLQRMGYIAAAGKIKNEKSNRPNTLWKVVDANATPAFN